MCCMRIYLYTGLYRRIIVVRKYIFAFLIIFGVTFLSATEGVTLAHLNSDTVEQDAQNIERELCRNMWHKRLSCAAGICALLSGGCWLFWPKSAAVVSGLINKVISTQRQNENKKVTLKNIDKKLNKLEKLIKEKNLDTDNDNFKKVIEFVLEKQKKSDTGFGGTFKKWSLNALNFVARETLISVTFSVVMGALGKYFRSLDTVVDKVTYKVFHPGNLQWYIATHTNIFTLLNELERHAYCIENKCFPKKGSNDETSQVIFNEDQVNYHIQAFVTTWSLCTRKFESILGFMSMKVKQEVDKENINKENTNSDKPLAKRYVEIIEHIYCLADNFIENAEKLLYKDATTTRTGVVQAVKHLKLSFMEERFAFTNCETS